MLSKTANLSCRVNPDTKERAEAVLDRLGISMSTAIEMYLNQIDMVKGIPFQVVIRQSGSYDADYMTSDDIHLAIAEGIADADAGRVQSASEVLKKFKEKNNLV